MFTFIAIGTMDEVGQKKLLQWGGLLYADALVLAALALWITNFFTTASFPVIKQGLGLPLTFGFHAALCFVYFLFVRARISETRGKSLEEIEAELTEQDLTWKTTICRSASTLLNGEIHAPSLCFAGV